MQVKHIAGSYVKYIGAGMMLSGGFIGAIKLIPTIVASLALVTVHKIIAIISVKNQMISHLVKGIPYSLYKEGKLNDKNLKKCIQKIKNEHYV